MEFQKITSSDKSAVEALSAMATEIIKEHFDPLIGAAQNDYMIEKFQSIPAIEHQLEEGYQYYFVIHNDERIGFLGFYPRGEAIYLSKFYLYKNQRGKGYAHQMLKFVIAAAKEQGLTAIELNVNRDNSTTRAYEAMGFRIIREEKNDIGHGFYMDDYVYQLKF